MNLVSYSARRFHSVECMLKNCKESIFKAVILGACSSMLLSYWDEFMWRQHIDCKSLVWFGGKSTIIGYLILDWTSEWWQWRGTPDFPKLEHYLSLTINFFSVIYRTLVEGVLLLCRDIIHHDVMPLARISLTLTRHFSLSFIASGRSSGLHPASSHSCCMYVLAGRPSLARPYVGVHRSTPLMSSSLLLQQCPVCLVRLTWIDIVGVFYSPSRLGHVNHWFFFDIIFSLDNVILNSIVNHFI